MNLVHSVSIIIFTSIDKYKRELMYRFISSRVKLLEMFLQTESYQMDLR